MLYFLLGDVFGSTIITLSRRLNNNTTLKLD